MYTAKKQIQDGKSISSANCRPSAKGLFKDFHQKEGQNLVLGCAKVLLGTLRDN